MKKLIPILLLVFAFAFNIQAQRKERKVSVEQVLKKMTKELNLTKAQQSEIKPLLVAQIADRKAMNKKRIAMREAGERPTKEMRIQFQKDRIKKETAMHKKMAAILNKEQFKKFKTIAKAKKEKGKKRKLQ
ncbi:Spy/CpxP family protein refolding chaperone [uncultured Polaribacter sp.]|uniref:Spy/CpxP family protein refolding chaperone n=1 Tax=uncultured Polaribacter sp. TaxID=174711 RepID=UPI00259B9FAF|nr:Spy/CpxP family protein refolding chaperone [uncultured Polaribacter sp.]